MAQTASEEQLCPDWIFSNNSNVHACKSRNWFTDYTPFESKAGTIYFPDENDRVIGIGTVVLPVKKAPTRTGPNAHGQLILHDVLHIPSSICNVLGLPTRFLEDYPTCTIQRSENSGGWISDALDRKVAYFVDHPVSKHRMLKLSGPPAGPRTGPTGFRNDVHHIINVRWSDVERARWEEYKKEQSRQTNVEAARPIARAAPTSNGSTTAAQSATRSTFAANTTNPPNTSAYTAIEKQWLKKHYGGEYHFLRAYGLKIFNEEDREEGRALLREFMSEDQAHEPAPEPEPDPPAVNAEGYATIRFEGPNFYTREEKRWLKANHGGESRFLQAEELNPFVTEQRHAGRILVRELIAAEGSEGKRKVDDALSPDDDGTIELIDSDEDVDEDDDEWDPEGHMADYHFDHKTLDWIDEHYGNSMNFMMSMGLKFYDDEDCEEAKAIAETMMRPDTPKSS